MREIVKVVLSVLTLCLVLTAARAARADCATDADCKNDRVCRQGQCTTLGCTTDKDCPGDLVCAQSRCTKEASSAQPAPAPPPPAPAPILAPPAATPPAAGAPPPSPSGDTAQTISGMETAVLDCSTAPNDPRCRGQRGMVLTERYVFPAPKQTFVQFSIHGAYNHGFVRGANIFSGGMDIGAAVAHGLGGAMPGPQGGWYNALVVEGLGGVYGGGLVTTGTPTQGAGAVFVRPFVRVGFEMDHFGVFDSADRAQGGIGLNVMYALGGDWEFLAGDFAGNKLFFGHGPEVALMLGKYLPLTSRLERGYLRLGLWNVPGAQVNFLQIGGGACFP